MGVSTAKVKGSGPRAARDYFIKMHGQPMWDQVLREVPEAYRKDMGDPLPFAWYPVQGFDAVCRGAYKLVAKEDPVGGDRLLREVGRYIAEDNLSTIYKVVLALAKPAHVLGMLPKLWYTYFQGIDATVAQTEKAPKGLCTVRGLASFGLAPAASGWIEFAYAKVGAKASKSVERAWAVGEKLADPMVFDIEWTA